MPRSQYGPAAGTNQGTPPLLSYVRVPNSIAFTREEMTRMAMLSENAVQGLYWNLRVLADFTNGQVNVEYAALMAFDTPPRTQQGPSRKPHTYEQMRRMLRDLEAVGLVVRDKANNALQGQLRLQLPYPVAAYREWLKTQPPRLSPQAPPQATKARKPA